MLAKRILPCLDAHAGRVVKGELLVTSVDRDGDGYDLTMLEALHDRVSVPVVASGGAGTLNHLRGGLRVADAVLAASIFHSRTFSIPEAKQHLRAAGLPVRGREAVIEP